MTTKTKPIAFEIIDLKTGKVVHKVDISGEKSASTIDRTEPMTITVECEEFKSAAKQFVESFERLREIWARVVEADMITRPDQAAEVHSLRVKNDALIDQLKEFSEAYSRTRDEMLKLGRERDEARKLMVELVRCLGTERCGVCGELYSEPPTKTGCYLADHIEAWEALQKAGSR